ncbi:unnamed protein product [Bursaphelenchus xylophilus]|uniref:(pine wood nematode) hypothetical protein n=1 Tax=Bursaphelenchus xylophilus TaxID=6326 RepID=A0A7I8WTC6_BURXY|nr:unnamed protein product [Bursaphelenchus xylophilus]CAG9116053.1 unnamed protein product [Bursaphelenchus xylophilus]
MSAQRRNGAESGMNGIAGEVSRNVDVAYLRQKYRKHLKRNKKNDTADNTKLDKDTTTPLKGKSSSLMLAVSPETSSQGSNTKDDDDERTKFETHTGPSRPAISGKSSKQIIKQSVSREKLPKTSAKREEDEPTEFVRVARAKPAKCRKHGRKVRNKKKTEDITEEDKVDKEIKRKSWIREGNKEDHVIRAKRKIKKKNTVKSEVELITSALPNGNASLPDVDIDDETDDTCVVTESEAERNEPSKLTTAETLINSQFGQAVLEKMHEGKAFDNALSPTESEELSKFFDGKIPFSNNVIELLDKGMERGIITFRNTTPHLDSELLDFLANTAKAKALLVDTILTNQGLLPKQWNGKGSDEKEKSKNPKTAPVTSTSDMNVTDSGNSVGAEYMHSKEKESEKHNASIDSVNLKEADVISFSLVPQTASSNEKALKPTTANTSSADTCPEENDLSFLPASYSMPKK